MLAVTLFCFAYLGTALGKIPGLVIDRVGVALLGAVGMVVFGVVTPENAFKLIGLPTILLPYSLMIMRDLRENLTLAALRPGIENSKLSDHLKELAQTHLPFAAEYGEGPKLSVIPIH